MTPKSLKNTRKKLRLSQMALAQKAEVSRFKIAVYELGQGTLFKEEIERIKNVLNAKGA